MIPLQFHRVVPRGASRPAGAFEIGAELLEERRVPREVVHDGHGLAATPRLFDAELRHDARWNGRFSSLAAAPAVVCGPAAAGTDAPAIGGEDQPGVGTILHVDIIRDRAMTDKGGVRDSLGSNRVKG